ncbi:hypothetical protein [Fervidobacterium sp.]
MRFSTGNYVYSCKTISPNGILYFKSADGYVYEIQLVAFECTYLKIIN